MTASEKENRRLRLAHARDVAWAGAERARVEADQAVDALGGEPSDADTERQRLIDAAAAAVARARNAAELLRRIEQAQASLERT